MNLFRPFVCVMFWHLWLPVFSCFTLCSGSHANLRGNYGHNSFLWEYNGENIRCNSVILDQTFLANFEPWFKHFSTVPDLQALWSCRKSPTITVAVLCLCVPTLFDASKDCSFAAKREEKKISANETVRQKASCMWDIQWVLSSFLNFSEANPVDCKPRSKYLEQLFQSSRTVTQRINASIITNRARTDHVFTPNPLVLFGSQTKPPVVEGHTNDSGRSFQLN